MADLVGLGSPIWEGVDGGEEAGADAAAGEDVGDLRVAATERDHC